MLAQRRRAEDALPATPRIPRRGGLLEAFDVKQLVALVAPRPVVLREPSARAKSELAVLKGWYALLRADFDPLTALSTRR